MEFVGFGRVLKDRGIYVMVKMLCIVVAVPVLMLCAFFWLMVKVGNWYDRINRTSDERDYELPQTRQRKLRLARKLPESEKRPTLPVGDRHINEREGVNINNGTPTKP
jgi:hypothetical protein